MIDDDQGQDDYKTKEGWIEEAISCYKSGDYKKALAACEQAIQIDSSFDRAYHGKGLALYYLGRYEESVLACAKATDLNVHNVRAYLTEGDALCNLERYGEAITTYKQAVAIDPHNKKALQSLQEAVTKLENQRHTDEIYGKELTYYEQIISSSKSDHAKSQAWVGKAETLYALKRYEEALSSYEQAIQLNPLNTNAHMGKKRIISERAKRPDTRSDAQVMSGKIFRSLTPFTNEVERNDLPRWLK